jgi:hypothetical protein
MKSEQNNFEGLIDNVYQTHCLLQQNAQKAINLNLTVRNWLIGCYIVEFEQNGEDRAKYGTRLLEEMAKSIKIRGIKGLNSRALRNCRLFYVSYPQIWRSVSAKLQQFDNDAIKPETSKDIPIRRTLSAKLEEMYTELQMANNQENTIRQTLSVELQTTDNQDDVIRGSVTREIEEEYPIPSKLLLSRLSFSHFLEIMSKNDPLERLFYEVEAIKNNWSVRELERAMDTAMYVRTGLSKDKEAIIRKFKKLII